MSFPFEAHGLQYRSRLGRGGTAEVARVWVERLGREAALKYPLEDGADNATDFSLLAQREYSLIEGIRFPGIVRLFPRTQQSGDYLLMEVCEGPSLDQLGRLKSLPSTLNIISAVASSLEYLNARGIIHGDLKPQNIFLPTDWERYLEGSLFYARLSDFSLGRRVDEPEESRAGLGTLGFMAPETIRESRTSIATDLFGLGVTAYQLLTGRHPYLSEDSDPARVTSRIIDGSVRPVGELRTEIPSELEELIHSLLAADETMRPRSPLEVCRMLSNLGATYPFERVLAPRYLIDAGRSCEENLAAVVAPDSPHTDRLRQLSEGSNVTLKLLLTANFRRGNLDYADGRFSFTSGVYWPSRLRRLVLRQFSRLPLNSRKAILEAAIANDSLTALTSDARTGPASPALISLMRPLLRPITVKRLSRRLSREAEMADNFHQAAGLYIQAGLLEKAEDCAYQEVAALRRDHRNQEALRLVARVTDYAGLTGREFSVRHLMLLRGDILKDSGETSEALKAYRSVIELYDDHENDKLLAETYKNLGDLYKLRQDFKSGIASLETARQIFTALDDQLEISRTLNNIANMHWVNSNMPEALRHYRAALHIQRRLKVEVETASTLCNIGALYSLMGRLERSINIGQLSLQLKREIGNLGEIARSLNNLGYAYVLRGDFARAGEHLSESLELNRRIGNQKEILINLSNLTDVTIKAGQMKKSLEYLKESRQLGDTLGDLADVAETQLKTGTVLRRIGRIAEALRALAASEEASRSVDSKRIVMFCSLERSAIRHYIGDSTKALQETRAVLAEARQIGDIQTVVEALLLMARLSDEEDYLEEILRLTQREKMAREYHLASFAAAEAQLEKENTRAVLTVLDEQLRLPLEWRNDIEIPWMCNIVAEAMIDCGRADEAHPYLTRAEKLARQTGLKPELVTSLSCLGQLTRQSGDYEKAFALYREALTTCKTISDSLDEEADRSLYQNKRTVRFLTGEIRRLSELLVKK